MTVMVTDDPQLRARPGHQRRGWSIVLGVAVAVVAALVGGYWLSHTNAIASPGNIESLPVPIGETMAIATNIQSSGSIHLQAVRPQVTQNSSNAQFQFVLCWASGLQAVGSMKADQLGQICSRIEPLTPGVMAVGFPPSAQVVLEVTPRQPGKVAISWFNVTYRDGLQSGTQPGGIQTIVRTPPG